MTSCDALQKQCESCYDATLKQACFTSVVTYKSGGDAGLGGCQAVLDSKTYDSASTACAKPPSPCDKLAAFCTGCENEKQKTSCNELVKKKDDAKCESNMQSFEPYSPGNGPGYPPKGSPCCDPNRPADMDAQCAVQ